MPSKYISTSKKVQEHLDEMLEQVNEISKPQLYLHMLRRVGANQSTVDNVLNLYAEADELIVTEDSVRKP